MVAVESVYSSSLFDSDSETEQTINHLNEASLAKALTTSDKRIIQDQGNLWDINKNSSHEQNDSQYIIEEIVDLSEIIAQAETSFKKKK